MRKSITGHPTTKDPGSKYAFALVLVRAISEALGGMVLVLICKKKLLETE
jgi:hypothetical protein